MPTITLECYKDGDNIETITLQGKVSFIFGRNQGKVDVPLLHDSISRAHAAIVLDQDQGAILIDLDSTSGTQVNKNRLQQHTAQVIKTSDEVQFGASTRLYKLIIDYSKYQRALQEKQRALQIEIHQIESLSDYRIEDLRKKLGSNSCDTVYVGNLPYHFEQAELRSLLRECGDIVSIELKKGFAFVQLGDQKGVKRALNFDGHKVMGRPIKVNLKTLQAKERDKSPPERRHRRD